MTRSLSRSQYQKQGNIPLKEPMNSKKGHDQVERNLYSKNRNKRKSMCRYPLWDVRQTKYAAGLRFRKSMKEKQRNND